jgi:hypothetical protein
MKRFLKGRIDLVKALAANEPMVSYADLVLIITAVLSACASCRWPGKRIDKKRFIELLVMHSPSDYRTSWISVPALINDAFIDESDTPYGIAGNCTRIYRDDEIDLSFEDFGTKYPNVPIEEIRKHCYASLIYDWLRCGYCHEYCAHENINQAPASRQEARVSYIGRSSCNKIIRMVSFHLDYLIRMAEHHISILPITASSPPSMWWIDQK